jgi:hypothetical protein
LFILVGQQITDMTTVGTFEMMPYKVKHVRIFNYRPKIYSSSGGGSGNSSAGGGSMRGSRVLVVVVVAKKSVAVVVIGM